jgi:hypothetical protein
LFEIRADPPPVPPKFACCGLAMRALTPLMRLKEAREPSMSVNRKV